MPQVLLSVGFFAFFAVLFVIHRGIAQATSRRQVTDEENCRPYFIIAENSFGPWHPGRLNPVIDYPFQLPIGVRLDLGRIERWHRRRHTLRERDACILTIHPMTGHTVV
jgi:hypothetical protein